ncbi:MAG: glucose-1-phosphate adenylyltransferase [Saprospiraceae bacterium]|nr:glucose-1-phosphate adenylyltransferase [Saprospiraceae bacterium]
MSTTERTVAIILGGGVGSRLYPLTAQRSKPAVPIAGKYRLIDIPISNCINSKIHKMFVLTMFNSASLNMHIKNTYHFDMFSSGFVDILAAEQTRDNLDWFQGTADAVRQSMSRLKKVDHDYVLILSGDQLYNMDLEEILENHKNSEADLTIATIPVVEKEATSFGIMKTAADGNIDSFVEKPSLDEVGNWKSELPSTYTDQGKDYLASMGIYVFNKQAMDDLFAENEGSNDFGKEIIPYAVNTEKYKVKSYLYDGYWADIGNIHSFWEENLKLTSFLPEFHLYDNVRKIYTHARMLAPTKIFGTVINFGLFSEGCICHAKEVANSVVGVRSRIGRNTVIYDSIVMGNDRHQTVNEINELDDNELLGIGSHCYIQRAILDKNVRIGNNVTIIGDDSLEDTETDTYCIREGVVVIKKNAYIEDNIQIGKSKV